MNKTTVEPRGRVVSTFEVASGRGTCRTSVSQFVPWPFDIWAKLTFRTSNMAMENGPLISDFPMKTSIHRGFSIPMFGYQRVSLNTHKEKILFTRRLSSSWWQRKDFHPAVEIVLETPNSQRIRTGNVIYPSFALQ